MSTIREWCDSGDEFCDKGNNTKTHTGYFARYLTEAAEFVVERYNASAVERAEPTVLPTAPQVSEGNAGAKGVAGRGYQHVSASGMVLVPVVLGWVGL